MCKIFSERQFHSSATHYKRGDYRRGFIVKEMKYHCTYTGVCKLSIQPAFTTTVNEEIVEGTVGKKSIMGDINISIGQN